MELVTIGVVNYNGMAHLADTLRALEALDYPNMRILVADNASTDGSREHVLKHFPQIRVIELNQNLGLPGARNALLEAAESEYVLILDNDIEMESDSLRKLIEVMESNPQIAAAHPEICDPNDANVHRYNGGSIHYLCTLIAREAPQTQEARPNYEIFDVVSGGTLIMRKSVAEKVGNFDADYFFNWEDGDFTSRLTLAGYLCVNVPAARVHHKGKARGKSKVFYQIRNRWYFIAKLYSWKTILLISPALIVFELSMLLFMLFKGAFVDYVRGSFAALKDFGTLMQKRRRFKTLKNKRDREWLKKGDMFVPDSLVKPGLLQSFAQLYYKLLNGYWSLVKPLL